MISIILPFFYYDEHRYNLFRKTFEHLPLNDERFEICIHEMGKEPFLDEFFTKNNKYLFSKFEGIFDRAWSLNVPAKHLATRNMLCLMDTDLLVSEDWKEEIVKCKTWSAGFGELRYLSSRATDIFLKTDKIVEEYQYFVDGGQKARSIIVPKGAKGAGGITLFPRKLFIELKGIPEEFKGTWGGEDTAFFHKVKTLKKITPTRINSLVYHLYHPPTTKIDKNVKQNAKIMKNWSKDKWLDYIKNVRDWGNPHEYE